MATAMGRALRRTIRWLRAKTWRWLSAIAALALFAIGTVYVISDDPKTYRVQQQRVTVHSGPSGQEPIRLDTSLYVPKTATSNKPAEAVLLAHGFGGSKSSVSETAQELAERGFVVLAYSARGFGRSGGEIHLNSPDYEIKDASRLLDWLAQRADVRKDRAGDPRVAVVGGSYGGGLALMLAGYDQRVDAIVPQITWHDLAHAFFPNAGNGDALNGVFKRFWAGLFFGTATEPAALLGRAGPNVQCGRFADEICRTYLEVATTGRATPAAIELLKRSSPASVIDKITAPTLLVQGTQDTLFGLDEADANASGIAKTGTPVRVAWFIGGHDTDDSPQSDVDRTKFLTLRWLEHYLQGKGKAPADSFTYSQPAGFDTTAREPKAKGFVVDDYPGLAGDDNTQVSITGPPVSIVNPPDGTPAAISTIPLAGVLGSLGSLAGLSQEIPGQHANYISPPLDRTINVVGAPTVTIRAASPTGQAALFVKLYDQANDGKTMLPNGLVAPVRLTGLPASINDAQPVQITLPAIAYRFEAGHRLRLVIATSDQTYATPPEPAVYQVAVGNVDSNGGNATAIRLPEVTSSPIASRAAVLRWVLVGLAVAITLGVIVAMVVAHWRHRRADRSTSADDAATPLVVSHLRKVYADGFVAVDDVSFTVEPHQVVGLLGPNGAGKTTTLRVLMGLIKPTAGHVLIFGHQLAPGAPVLSQLGALVEGPGFLPHLSGLDNLRLYWRSTGRPYPHARLTEVLEIAGLGSAINRKVRTYSHGMKQRLAIAQAMLGMPRLLVLDEPTDGLDPPQIAQMRRVLHRYATEGRAVLVSSHLLAEVEQTCTHVVVLHQGQRVAGGTVSEIIGDSPTVLFDVSDSVAALRVLGRLPGVASVGQDNGAVVAELANVSRSAAVAALVDAGIAVDRVVPRRRLEDAFLALVRDSGTDNA